MKTEPKVQIRKRVLKRTGKAVYDVRYRDPKTGKYKSERVGNNQDRARDRRAVLERELAKGTHRSIEAVQWEAFISGFCAEKKEANRALANQALTEFAAFVRRLGCDTVKAVRYEHLIAYRSSLSEKNRQATINKKLRYLKAAFRHAEAMDLCERSPFGRKKWTWNDEDDRRPIRVATEAEIDALLDAAGERYGDVLRAFILVALGTAGRRSELVRLSWGNVDLKGCGWLKFTKTKTRRDRRVPMDTDAEGDAAREALGGLRLKLGGPFLRYQRESELRKEWEDVRKAAGAPDLMIHDLRRTAITRWVLAGIPQAIVQRWAGHEVPATTGKYYIGIDDERARLAAKAAIARRATAG